MNPLYRLGAYAALFLAFVAGLAWYRHELISEGRDEIVAQLKEKDAAWLSVVHDIDTKHDVALKEAQDNAIRQADELNAYWSHQSSSGVQCHATSARPVPEDRAGKGSGADVGTGIQPTLPVPQDGPDIGPALDVLVRHMATDLDTCRAALNEAAAAVNPPAPTPSAPLPARASDAIGGRWDGDLAAE